MNDLFCAGRAVRMAKEKITNRNFPGSEQKNSLPWEFLRELLLE
jgi:hypothetical protein